MLNLTAIEPGMVKCSAVNTDGRYAGDAMLRVIDEEVTNKLDKKANQN